jgi:4-hydroxythreonine-4-phosphate dehydrogenase
MPLPVFALTQGDPAGIGPEILLKVLTAPVACKFRPLLVAERSALEALRTALPDVPWRRLHYVDSAADLPTDWNEALPVLDPVQRKRSVPLGVPSREDASGALAALDTGIALMRDGHAQALVTAPLGKATIAEHLDADFRGHTDYLARAAGLKNYGRDYLMTFLAPKLKVALLTTHLPLRKAIEAVTTKNILEALHCLARHIPGDQRIAVAGLNPHAGEGGLLGFEDDEQVRPAVDAAQRDGINALGPISADSLFARAQQGEFDWVLALYHDQGLVAVKTAAFGTATNWTLGLPFLRTSVDHGTAYDIAGHGVADARPLAAALETTLELFKETAHRDWPERLPPR